MKLNVLDLDWDIIPDKNGIPRHVSYYRSGDPPHGHCIIQTGNGPMDYEIYKKQMAEAKELAEFQDAVSGDIHTITSKELAEFLDAKCGDAVSDDIPTIKAPTKKPWKTAGAMLLAAVGGTALMGYSATTPSDLVSATTNLFHGFNHTMAAFNTATAPFKDLLGLVDSNQVTDFESYMIHHILADKFNITSDFMVTVEEPTEIASSFATTITKTVYECSTEFVDGDLRYNCWVREDFLDSKVDAGSLGYLLQLHTLLSWDVLCCSNDFGPDGHNQCIPAADAWLLIKFYMVGGLLAVFISLMPYLKTFYGPTSIRRRPAGKPRGKKGRSGRKLRRGSFPKPVHGSSGKRSLVTIAWRGLVMTVVACLVKDACVSYRGA